MGVPVGDGEVVCVGRVLVGGAHRTQAGCSLFCAAILLTACAPTPLAKSIPSVTVTATPTSTPGRLIVAGSLNLHGPRTNFVSVDAHPDAAERCTSAPGEFQDIGEGTPVDVSSTTDAATVVATGVLEQGFVIDVKHTVMCAFRFAILDVPAGLGMYRISTEGRDWGPESERVTQQPEILRVGA